MQGPQSPQGPGKLSRAWQSFKAKLPSFGNRSVSKPDSNKKKVGFFRHQIELFQLKRKLKKSVAKQFNKKPKDLPKWMQTALNRSLGPNPEELGKIREQVAQKQCDDRSKATITKCIELRKRVDALNIGFKDEPNPPPENLTKVETTKLKNGLKHGIPLNPEIHESILNKINKKLEDIKEGYSKLKLEKNKAVVKELNLNFPTVHIVDPNV